MCCLVSTACTYVPQRSIPLSMLQLQLGSSLHQSSVTCTFGIVIMLQKRCRVPLAVVQQLGQLIAELAQQYYMALRIGCNEPGGKGFSKVAEAGVSRGCVWSLKKGKKGRTSNQLWP